MGLPDRAQGRRGSSGQAWQVVLFVVLLTSLRTCAAENEDGENNHSRSVGLDMVPSGGHEAEGGSVPTKGCTTWLTITTKPGDNGQRIARRFFPGGNHADTWTWIVACNPTLVELYANSTSQEILNMQLPPGTVTNIPDFAGAVREMVGDWKKTVACNCTSATVNNNKSFWQVAVMWSRKHNKGKESQNVFGAGAEIMMCNPTLQWAGQKIMAGQMVVGGCDDRAHGQDGQMYAQSTAETESYPSTRNEPADWMVWYQNGEWKKCIPSFSYASSTNVRRTMTPVYIITGQDGVSSCMHDYYEEVDGCSGGEEWDRWRFTAACNSHDACLAWSRDRWGYEAASAHRCHEIFHYNMQFLCDAMFSSWPYSFPLTGPQGVSQCRERAWWMYDGAKRHSGWTRNGRNGLWNREECKWNEHAPCGYLHYLLQGDTPKYDKDAKLLTGMNHGRAGNNHNKDNSLTPKGEWFVGPQDWPSYSNKFWSQPHFIPRFRHTYGPIRSMHTGRCMDVGGMEKGVLVELKVCSWEEGDAANYEFYGPDCGGGCGPDVKRNTVVPRQSLQLSVHGNELVVGGKCLDAWRWSTWPSDPRIRSVGVWDCHTGDNQKWFYDYKQRIHSVQWPDHCLDEAWGQLALAPCTDVQWQKWAM